MSTPLSEPTCKISKASQQQAAAWRSLPGQKCTARCEAACSDLQGQSKAEAAPAGGSPQIGVYADKTAAPSMEGGKDVGWLMD